ncbi:MAG: stage II sporulation protein P [Christensenellaceae bacterium]|jgi:stage II sporulation protein P|nr:stage II sporulation protein P [Christensenellaceae bacterium]
MRKLLRARRQAPRVRRDTPAKRIKPVSYGPTLAALFFCCLGALFLHSRSYYGGAFDFYHALSALQLPLLYSLPYASDAAPRPQAPLVIAGIDIASDVSNGIRVELFSTAPSPTVDLSGADPKILIYHTHTTEAYFKTPAHDYTDAGKWRTTESEHNIVAVGEKLATLLRDQYGISVLHDMTDHEPPKLATSYSRSVRTMKDYRAKYPSLSMYIDVHRDSYSAEDPKKPSDYVVIDGKEVARLMFVVGTGEGATGTGYGEMPDFAANYALAKRITESLAKVEPGLVRNIRVKTGRYNQHISNQCLLVEVGHNGNTLEQALNAIDYLAAAIAEAAGLAEPQGGASRLFTP